MTEMDKNAVLLKSAGWNCALISDWNPPWIKQSIIDKLSGHYSMQEALLIQADLNKASALTGLK